MSNNHAGAHHLENVRKANYCREYRAWLMTLSPAERARLKSLSLDRPDDGSVKMWMSEASADAVVSRGEGGVAETLASLCADSSAIIPGANIDPVDPDREQSAGLSEAMAAFLQWIVSPDPRSGLSAKAIGQRAVAAMWVLRPDLIGNRTLTNYQQVGEELGAVGDRTGRRGRKVGQDVGR